MVTCRAVKQLQVFSKVSCNLAGSEFAAFACPTSSKPVCVCIEANDSTARTCQQVVMTACAVQSCAAWLLWHAAVVQLGCCICLLQVGMTQTTFEA